MAKVKSKNTLPELLIFAELDKLNLNYSKHYQTHGKPDIAFPDLKLAVFINGEFWHGKNYDITSNTLNEFWSKKIKGNVQRDNRNYRKLRKEGWKIIILWDKAIIKNPSRESTKVLNKLSKLAKPNLQI